MGLPRVLTSDQGSEFNNELNKELMTLMKIDHRLTTAYHPQVSLCVHVWWYMLITLMVWVQSFYLTQANGLDERFNQTIQSMLVKFCHKSKTNWDDHLDTCTFAYNTSKHNSTKYCPFELMFGRKPVLPVELDTCTDSPEATLSKFQSAQSIESNPAFVEKLIDARLVHF